MKQLEANVNFNFDNHYLECKIYLEQIHQEKANGIKIRSKCDWYKFGEKSSKFFLNLEKQHALQNQFRTLLCGQNETKLIVNCIIFIKQYLQRNFKSKMKK